MECNRLKVIQAASDSSFFNHGHRLSPHKVNYCCHRTLKCYFLKLQHQLPEKELHSNTERHAISLDYYFTLGTVNCKF